MQLLIAHGDKTSRLALKRVAAGAGEFEIVEAGEGPETLERLLAADSPALAVVDWDLPGIEGPELCRLVRAYHEAGPPYVVLLARSDHSLADGLEAGADDCVHTPVLGDELQARINVGRRFAELPWQRVGRAAALPEDHARERPSLMADEPVALSAQRSINGDEFGDELGDDGSVLPAGRIKLESVLVLH